MLHDSGRELLLCGAAAAGSHLMERADFHRHVGDENIWRNIGDASRRLKPFTTRACGAARCSTSFADRLSAEVRLLLPGSLAYS
jgi:hypothetical protein